MTDSSSPETSVSKLTQLKNSLRDRSDGNESFIGFPEGFFPEEIQQKLQGGYSRSELITISGINSNADIPMRVSKLADGMVVLVNDHPIDPEIEHKVALDDVVSLRQITMSDSKSFTVPSDEYSIYVGERGKVGAAITRKRKKAMRKLRKRKH